MLLGHGETPEISKYGDYERAPKLSGPIVGPLPPIKRCPYVEPDDTQQKRCENVIDGHKCAGLCDVMAIKCDWCGEAFPAGPRYDCIRDAPPYGYAGDAGHTNGGISGYNATHEQTEGKNDHVVYGVDAFRSVEPTGVAELAWYFSASACEVGLSSSFDDMVQASMTGPRTAPSTAPMGPNEIITRAAERQAAVRAVLRELWPSFRVVLEIGYEDRRRRTEDVIKYGHGVANLMSHMEGARRDMLATPIGSALDALQRLLMALSGHPKRGVPQWQPMTPNQAKRILDAAQAAYVSLRSGYQPPRKRKSKKPPKRTDLVVADKRSMSPRRQLFAVTVAA